MIPRKYRLKHDKDFEILFKEGMFIRGSIISAKVWKIEPEKYPRRSYTANTLLIGFVVSKKVDKRAVVRNKTKRKIREAVRLILKENVVREGYLIAFMANPHATQAPFSAVQKDVERVLQKAHII